MADDHSEGATAREAGATPRAPQPRRGLADRVYRLLHTRIAGGDYATGSKMPSEMTLAEECGVSRPVVRAALERLRREGLIYSRRGAGSYVRAAAAPHLDFARVETIADLQRCYEFRIAIESEAAGLAARRRGEADLAAMEAAMRRLDSAALSPDDREDADFDFHAAVTAAAHNQYFDTVSRALREHIHVGMKLRGQGLMSESPKGLTAVYGEHSSILEAIRGRDAVTASEAMRQHLVRSRDRLFGGAVLDLNR